MRRDIRIPTLFGLLLAIGGLTSGLWLLQGQLRNAAEAAAEESPKEVRIANISDTGFVVTWVTERAVSGFVQYGPSGSATDLVISDDRDQQRGEVSTYSTHFVSVKGLSPSTKYLFRIGSGGGLYEKNGQPYEITTGPTIADPPAADVSYGQVVDDLGSPAEGALVFFNVQGASSQATLVKSTGAWVIPLSTARTTDLSKYFEYDKSTTKIEIFVRGGVVTTTAVTTTGKDSPVEEITLGKNYDFTNDITSNNRLVESKFTNESLSRDVVTEVGALTILTPKFGEKVNSFRPEIIGEAPAGATITIEIHSNEVITDTVVADQSGNYSYSVPTDLSPGEHSLTISTTIDGVVSKITRSFTVYAAGESDIPAFSATPSATLVPSLSPTKPPSPTKVVTMSPTLSPKPTMIPTKAVSITTAPTMKPTATPKASPTPRPTNLPAPTSISEVKPSSQSALPQSGNDLATILIAGLGFVLIASGSLWYRFSD